MHELALTEGILKIVASEQKKKGFSHVQEIHLSVGEYSGVIPGCIEEFFPLVSKDTAAEGAKLVMDTVPAEFRCFDCDYEGPVKAHTACCPKCKSTAISMTKGREFFVKELLVQ